MDYSRNRNEITLDNKCKICLQSTSEIQSLDFIGEKGISTLEKITLCFHIVLFYEKSLPLFICSQCVNELETAYSFRVKCLTYNKRYSGICKTNEIKIEYHNFRSSETYKVNDNSNVSDISPEDSLLASNVEGTMNEMENNCKETIKCFICNKVLKTEESLVKHNFSIHFKQKHLGKVTGTGPSRRYHCPKCSYNTPHSQTLVNHMRRHNGDRPYHCECGKRFTQSSSLAAHRKIHSNTTFYTCTICGKQFKHAFTLKKHQLVHEDGKFICDICNKYLKTKKSLQDHIHRHYRIRNYNCEHCGDTFVTSSELVNHRKKHNLYKNVECHLCGYKTHTKKNLIVHLKRHAGEKTHKCNNCFLTFYTNGDLQRHMRVHTREKPYGCPTCTQRFTHSPSLNKHMLTVHGVVYKWADSKWKELKKDKMEMKIK